MTTAVLILSVSALIFTVIQNRRLSSQIAALADAQTATENRLDKLSKKARRTTNKQRAYDRKLEQQRKRQTRLAKQQKQLREEQKKQAQNISKLQFKMQMAESDIAAAQDRLTSLFAILDCVRAQQAETVPGSPADVRLARQAVVLESQIVAAERKLAKAQFDRSQAAEAMAA